MCGLASLLPATEPSRLEEVGEVERLPHVVPAGTVAMRRASRRGRILDARPFNQLAVEKVTISRRRVPYGTVAEATAPACAGPRASPVAHDSRGGTMATSVLDDLKRVCHRLRSAVDPDAGLTREAL